MIVTIPRIGCDAIIGGRVFGRIVIEGEDHYGLAAGKNDSRIGTAFGISSQPGHVAVFAVFNPFLEMVGMTGAASRGDSKSGEAEFLSATSEFPFELCWRKGAFARSQTGSRHESAMVREEESK